MVLCMFLFIIQVSSCFSIYSYLLLKCCSKRPGYKFTTKAVLLNYVKCFTFYCQNLWQNMKKILMYFFSTECGCTTKWWNDSLRLDYMPTRSHCASACSAAYSICSITCASRSSSLRGASSYRASIRYSNYF